ncbi:MAG: enoyl-CoA hydratase-related protein [Acidobacteriota bacterium]|nr:enoyl-CoA hydratase-related protein [Acidobacteriota bacterium]
MMTEPSRNEFIETIRAESAAEATENLRLMQKEKTRVVVLIVENRLENEGESLYEAVKNVEIPVILALKSSAAERFVDACHLCIASPIARIGEILAADALKWGLINKIADFEAVEDEAFSLAEKISRLAPLAIRACLKAVAEGFDLSLEEGLKIELGLFEQIFSTADMREGTRAFLEKRAPVFTGE